MKSYRNVQSEQEAEEEPELDEMSVEEQLAQLEDSLSDSEKISVAATVDDEREYLYKDTYYRESIYMHGQSWYTEFRQRTGAWHNVWEQYIRI